MLAEDYRSPYVDFSYYQNTYHGNLVSEEEFGSAELEAESYVNAITFGRIQRLDEIPDCVKKAICSATEEMHLYLTRRNAPVKSESNDGYSVTYADAIGESECIQSMKRKVSMHLANTGLMYKGWSKKYDKQCGHYHF